MDAIHGVVNIIKIKKYMSEFIKSFKEVGKENVNLAGGKGASLGEMTRVGFPVPPGFMVTALAFEEFLKQTDVNVEIRARINKINLKDTESVEES